jgi:flagellar P-ring protein precursor FlgI
MSAWIAIKRFLLIGLVALLLAVTTREASARVRLENICTIYGQKSVKLTGVGLVVGLQGTGDGGKNLPAMRALAAALKLMNSPVVSTKELQDAKNVAMVFIEATVPRTGLRRGQRIDCYVSSMMGAKSLRGGRLLVTPLETSEIGNDSVVAIASGPVNIEDEDIATTGIIPTGALLEENFVSLFIDKQRGHRITLLLDEFHSGFNTASEIARVINFEFSHIAKNSEFAKATGPGVVEVEVPDVYVDSPVEFVAEMLAIGIENPHSQAKVVVNAKTGTVVVTGEVEISPVIITHKNITVAVDGAAPSAANTGRFVDLGNQQTTGTPGQLQHLVSALNQLRVPKEDVIHIVRELHRSGKLHAIYDEH